MKVSLIIPAYNAEHLIESAIGSVTQTPPSFDYEILVVNDGSTDHTGQLLDRLARRIPPLRVLHRENAGPAAARNAGLQEARGDYILFCDSDDTFTPGALEQAVTLCEEKGADLLIFGFNVVQNGESTPYYHNEAELFSKQELGAALAPLYRANMLNQVWGKVFSRKLIAENRLQFPQEKWGEDRLFFFSALEKAERVAVSPLCLYNYVQQKSSLISRFLPEKPRVCREIHLRILRLAKALGETEPEGEAVYSYMYLKSLLSAFSTLFAPSCPLTLREKLRYVKEALRQKEIGEIRRLPKDAGLSFRILSKIIFTRNATLNLAAAWGIQTLSRLSPALFRKAKHAYNKNKKEK
ncbi:MAG: glycosyltransferase family 2 protein [Clostridia bacterium]|nr:glycosyltransferase family 2 protein [Clostridia bacterium]